MFSNILRSRLKRAQRVAVLTGAGISAESGISTFRDAGGLWEQFRPEELANLSAFLRNPSLVQGWYAMRREVVLKASPNAGHVALAEMERRFEDFTLITQNVDGLHQRAGNQNVLELHGNILRNYCITCKKEATEEDLEKNAAGNVGSCPNCNGLIRPDVVWFGEYLPEQTLGLAQRAAARADVFFTIGTSGLVYPAADLPLQARMRGAYVVEINVERSAIADEVDEVILGKAGDVLPQLMAIC